MTRVCEPDRATHGGGAGSPVTDLPAAGWTPRPIRAIILSFLLFPPHSASSGALLFLGNEVATTVIYCDHGSEEADND